VLPNTRNTFNNLKNSLTLLLNVHRVSFVRQLEGTQLRHQWMSLNRPTVKLVLSSLKGIDCEILITFRQNWLEQEMKCYILRSVNWLTPFRKERVVWAVNGLGCSTYLRNSEAIDVVIIKASHCYQHHIKLCPTSFSQG
jgi:hypothetical protein